MNEIQRLKALCDELERTDSDEELRKRAVEYVATHQADYSQIFTSPECKIHKVDNDCVAVQVWVGIPSSVKLSKLDW